MDVPKFSAKPDIARVLVPQTIGLFAMGGIFYALLMTNLSFAFKQVSNMTNYMIVAGLAVLLTTETVVNYMKTSNMQYHFFNNNVVAKSHGKEESILYNEIPSVTIKRNLLDRLFRTVTLVFTPKFKIKFIKDQNNLHFNIQKIVQRSRNLGAVDET